jgi:ribosomal protein S18 acetylase RimI-like enzyme
MHIRNVQPTDYPPIITVLNDWWGGRRMSDMLPKLFFVHFRGTSFIAEDDVQIVGFLIGFFSQTYADEAYIHFVGVHPAHRAKGIGRALYEHFFEVMREHNRSIVRCVTAPINKGSIAFHTRMGFQTEGQEAQMDGIPFDPDYDGVGEHRVLFVKRLSQGAG